VAKLCPKLNQEQKEELWRVLKQVGKAGDMRRIQAVILLDEEEEDGYLVN